MSSRNEVSAPAIGGLLRLAWQLHRARLYDALSDEFDDITRAQFELIRWPGLDGMRPSEIGQSHGLSKQTVNDLLGELEAGRYVERRPDPRDGRARIVRLTPHGRRMQRRAHALSRDLEAEWSQIVNPIRCST
jgi:DNA-binding MarR family transcriptional regulator